MSGVGYRYVDLYVTDSFRFGFGLVLFLNQPPLCWADPRLACQVCCKQSILNTTLTRHSLYRAAVVGLTERPRFLLN